MNTAVYVVGVLIIYLTGFFWGYLTFEVTLTGEKFVLMLILHSVLIMVGSYLTLIGSEPD